MIWWQRLGAGCPDFGLFRTNLVSPQIMNPIKHLCEELIEQKSMRETFKRHAADLEAGGWVPLSKRPKQGGGVEFWG